MQTAVQMHSSADDFYIFKSVLHQDPGRIVGSHPDGAGYRHGMIPRQFIEMFP